MMFTLSLLFTATTALVMLVVAWWWLCFKIGCWMFGLVFRRAPRPRELHVLAPELAPVYACSYQAPRAAQPPPPPQQKRSGICSSRRCHPGGAGVVMTVLAVAMVVFAFRSYARHRTPPRASAQSSKS